MRHANIFFDKGFEGKAKAVCDVCPLHRYQACRDSASSRMEPYGVYGGESGKERILRLLGEAEGTAPVELWRAFEDMVADAFEDVHYDALSASELTGVAVEAIRKNTSIAMRPGPRRKHPKGTAAALAAIASRTEETGVLIRQLAKSGMPMDAIAKELGISVPTVYKRTWTMPGYHRSEKTAKDMAALFEALDSGETLLEARRRLDIGERTAWRYFGKYKAAKDKATA